MLYAVKWIGHDIREEKANPEKRRAMK